MFKMCIILFGLHLLISGIAAEHTNLNNNHTATSLLDKQHDYKIDFERLELARYDKRYLEFFNIRTFKYNRTCPLVNATFMLNVDVGYNFEMILQVYKFASNEYRTFPIRFQTNFCEAINKDMAGVGDFCKCGNFTGCPLRKGQIYNICNWSPNPAKFPPSIPNGQYMIESQGMYQSGEMIVLHLYLTISRPIATPK